MTFKTFKTKLIRLISLNMSQWQMHQDLNSFCILFYNNKSNKFFIWSKGSSFNKEFHITGLKLQLRTIKYEDVFNMYIIEKYSHNNVLCIELKNGSNVMVGL